MYANKPKTADDRAPPAGLNRRGIAWRDDRAAPPARQRAGTGPARRPQLAATRRRTRRARGRRPSRPTWCPGTSPSSWTATAAGPTSAGCRAPRAPGRRGRADGRPARRDRARHLDDLGLRVLDRELAPLAGGGALPHGLQQGRHPPPPRRAGRASACASAGPGGARGCGAASSASSRTPRSTPATTTGSPCSSASTTAAGPRSSTRSGRSAARSRPAGSTRPRSTSAPSRRYLDEPGLPDVDLFIRTSGEQRTSNFLLWQSAYAELAFIDTPWPDFDRRHLWQACLEYAQRDRRFGAAGPVDPGGAIGASGLRPRPSQ